MGHCASKIKMRQNNSYRTQNTAGFTQLLYYNQVLGKKDASNRRDMKSNGLTLFPIVVAQFFVVKNHLRQRKAKGRGSNLGAKARDAFLGRYVNCSYKAHKVSNQRYGELVWAMGGSVSSRETPAPG